MLETGDDPEGAKDTNEQDTSVSQESEEVSNITEEHVGEVSNVTELHVEEVSLAEACDNSEAVHEEPKGIETLPEAPDTEESITAEEPCQDVEMAEEEDKQLEDDPEAEKHVAGEEINFASESEVAEHDQEETHEEQEPELNEESAAPLEEQDEGNTQEETIPEEEVNNELNSNEICNTGEPNHEAMTVETEVAEDLQGSSEPNEEHIDPVTIEPQESTELSADVPVTEKAAVSEENLNSVEAESKKEDQPCEEQLEGDGEPYPTEDSVDVSETNDVEMAVEDGVNGDSLEGDEDMKEGIELDSISSDSKSLPQCRLKRNYSCLHCGFTTQNPREHLYHLRDEHGERMKVFECPRCIYASKNHQKLIRHARMVHKLKIRRKDSSDSPYKKHSKPPREKISPSKSSRGSVSPGKSSRSSPGKSPRSSEGNDVWDEEEEEYVEEEDSPIKDDEKKLYYCEQCEYTCRSRKLLNRHETTFHLKRRFFRCVKCNYVTHLKGRYTKHMKYHQLPILKCEYCDFRTPYRWNLDRHMKNHTEDCGEYRCHLCNFTAQIKQSLTVHISNHHLTPEQIRERELRRTIGISDPADCTSDDQEMEMLRLERDEHPDALRLPGLDYPDSPSNQESRHNGNSFRVSNIDMGGNEDTQVSAEDGKDEDGEPKRKKPKIKITLKKMKEPKVKDTFFQELNERHNFEEDFIHPDDVVHRHGNVYIKTFKCHFCSFKAAFKNEVSRHEKKIHSVSVPKSDTHSKKTKKLTKAAKASRDHSDALQQILQYPQPAKDNEDLDVKPRRESSDHSGSIEKEEPETKDRVNGKSHNSDGPCLRSSDERESQSANTKEASPSKDVGKKKNSSFFDRLQEKISTSNVQNLVCQFCGHESKCLSESVRHQKLHLSAKNIYASASLSTRCQFCRHRCKTTDDLVNHLKLCPEARKNQIMDSGKRSSSGRHDGDDDDDDDYDGNDSGQDDYLDDTTPENESVNEDSKDEIASDALDDEKHPMENRVFVWNKIGVQEESEQGADENKSKMENYDSDREERDSKSDILDTPTKDSRSVTPELPLDYIESTTPQGHHYYSKRVYRCPQCSFWATTASRFHVHIVGHYNKKPYNCSECGYKSNWRWDITKHIKLKTTRDNSHQNADVVITDSTGEKNYEKYDRYLTIIQLDETNAHRTEGGIPTRKGRPKRTPEKDEEPEVVTPTTSPSRKPPMVTIPVTPRLQGLPRLTRAPGPSTSRPGPMPFGPILPGPQMMVQLASSVASTSSVTVRPPPPLSLRGTAPGKPNPTTTTTANTSSKVSAVETASNTITSGAQYQIITPQGAVNTSLETLQLLAAGTTNLSSLKKLQKDCGGGVNSEEKDSQNPISHQVSVSSTGEDGREVAKMVLDHEGNPEWKCNTCDFRDSERETVVQHVRLAHARGGPVNLLHAVHRCDVCGYAAGTKRAVQLHIDSSHNGQGGITSRCEGQTPDPKDVSGDGDNADHQESTRMLKCRVCPFFCKKRSEMRPHLAYHTPRADCIFKCMYCPFYVPSKIELFEHLRLHGMEIPAAMFDSVSKGNSSNSSSPAPSAQEDGSRQFLCGACPFETRSRSKLMHHRQFHRPKGLPFKCRLCTYNVTRRHLLSQHMRVHGVEPGSEEGLEATESNTDDRSNSPSPSLTITPVNNVAAVGDTNQDSTFTDASALPKLTDQTTMLLDDIPLVWVSRDNRFFKMFKCRHCPHVNLRKTNIQEHEKMHKPDAGRELGLHCPHCSYISVNAGVMSAHLKVHGGSMGQCHAIVDPALSDEEQLRLLTSKATSSPDASTCSATPIKQEVPSIKGDEKILYFCQQCPARFFFEKEIQIHSRFHSSTLPHHCSHCDFGAREQAHLLAHLKVHSPEYQSRTRTMMSQHRTSSTHPPVPGLSVPIDVAREIAPELGQSSKVDSRKRPYVASPPPIGGILPQPPPTSKYMCDQCPASFSKHLTLQYHQSLHGANNPHRCHRCSYAGKTEDNLKQHLQLHDQHDETVKAEKDAKAAVAASKGAFPDVETASTAAAPTTAAAAATGAVETSVKESTYVSRKIEKFRIEQPSKPHGHSKHDKDGTTHHPPIKLKLVSLRPISSDSSGGRPQFKYYVEEQVPLSGVDLLRRKTELEKEGQLKGPDALHSGKPSSSKSKSSREREDTEIENDPMRIGDPNLHYPLHIDKVTGKSREKRYKCNKCPSAFEKTEQYNVHINLHGSSHKYRCRICDYSVKFYANFMMHINRHKYHEKMVAQKAGAPLPPDDDEKYEPVINNCDNSSDGKLSKNKNEDKENLDDRDLTTTERQHLLLQNKKGIDYSKKEADKERQVYYCQYCPYANIRRDAVDSHSLRHLANGGYGVYKCSLCDYTASQLNFIKEHTKVHFRPFKYVHPEGFMRHDRQDILSVPVSSGVKRNDGPKAAEGSNQPLQHKHVVFSHESGEFKPTFPVYSDEEDIPDSQLLSGIKVNYRSGDVVDAPDDFVISLRPTKSKIVHKAPETSENLISENSVSRKNNTNELTANQSLIESTKDHSNEELANKVAEMGCHIESLVIPEAEAMEIEESKSDDISEKKANCDAASMTNGHFATEEPEVSEQGKENEASNDSAVESAVDMTVNEKMEVDDDASENLPKLPAVPKVWGLEQHEPLVSSH